jgi:hypothetical protein
MSLSGLNIILLLDVSKPLTTVYGYPLPAAMKLMRIIAAAGRNMASLLVCILSFVLPLIN